MLGHSSCPMGDYVSGVGQGTLFGSALDCVNSKLCRPLELIDVVLSWITNAFLLDSQEVKSGLMYIHYSVETFSF